jgi:hypothetical protein
VDHFSSDTLIKAAGRLKQLFQALPCVEQARLHGVLRDLDDFGDRLDGPVVVAVLIPISDNPARSSAGRACA